MADAATATPTRVEEEIKLSLQGQRLAIGLLGLSMPFTLSVFARWRETAELSSWPLDSVSAYYYSGATAIFTGSLFALAVALVTYRGYTNFRWDRVLGKIAGACAAGVALFPTSPPEGVTPPGWWRGWMSPVHFGCAFGLFLAFLLFAVWLFRRSDVSRDQRDEGKRKRDARCLLCGVVIGLSLVGALVQMKRGGAIYLPEMVAILAFSASWLVKAEAVDLVAEAGKRAKEGVARALR